MNTRFFHSHSCRGLKVSHMINNAPGPSRPCWSCLAEVVTGANRPPRRTLVAFDRDADRRSFRRLYFLIARQLSVRHKFNGAQHRRG